MACVAGQYPISVQEFKDYFNSDFNFSDVSDSVIEMFFEEACSKISNCLANSRYFKYAFRDLVAFLYCQKNGDKKAEGKLRFPGSIASWSNGAFSRTYQVPKAFIENPLFSMYASNPFGLSYLQMLYPCTRASLFISAGRTNY